MREQYHYQITKIWEYLQQKSIIGPAVSLTLDQPSNFSHYNDDRRQINIGLEEVEKEKDLDAEYPAIHFLLHEVGHALIHAVLPEDEYEDMHEERLEEEILISALHTNPKEWYQAYSQLPLEKEANELMYWMWEKIKENWNEVFPNGV